MWDFFKGFVEGFLVAFGALAVGFFVSYYIF